MLSEQGYAWKAPDTDGKDLDVATSDVVGELSLNRVARRDVLEEVVRGDAALALSRESSRSHVQEGPVAVEVVPQTGEVRPTVDQVVRQHRSGRLEDGHLEVSERCVDWDLLLVAHFAADSDAL